MNGSEIYHLWYNIPYFAQFDRNSIKPETAAAMQYPPIVGKALDQWVAEWNDSKAGRNICGNCDTPVPPGCSGCFKGEEGCWLNEGS